MKIERISATISGVGDPVFIYNSAKNIKTSKLRGTWFRSREELEFAVCRAVAGFGFDFYKVIPSGWIERHMKCSAYQGSYFEKE